MKTTTTTAILAVLLSLAAVTATPVHAEQAVEESQVSDSPDTPDAPEAEQAEPQLNGKRIHRQIDTDHARLVRMLHAAGIAYAPFSAPQLWITPGSVSHHFSRRGYNERNWGLGVEYRFNAQVAAIAGQYRNSVRETSHYLAVAAQPYVIGPVRLGVIVGIVNGYPEMRNGRFAPLILPVASIEGDRIGANITYVPSITGKVHGAVALQIKFRFL